MHELKEVVICLFLFACLTPSLSFRLLHRLKASYIDDNAAYEKASDRNMNANLGKEVLLYKDDDILVYSKPTSVQSSPGYAEVDSLSSRIAAQYNLTNVQRDQLVVHRLDYATSGVIVYARNVDALTALHAQFRMKKTYKRYSALVHGIFRHSLDGEIDLPLSKDFDNRPLNKVSWDNGKRSVTEWSVVMSDNANNITHVYLRPITGRTHQLRVHMSSIGHPILGDFFYSNRTIYESAKRLCLHAEELRFIHPKTGHPMRFIDPCPFSLDDY